MAFSVEIERLTRRKWSSVQQLAEEIYSIFTADAPVTLPGLTIDQPQGATTPPLTIKQGQNSGYNAGGDPGGVTAPAISIQHGAITTTITGGPAGGDVIFGGTSIGPVTFGGPGSVGSGTIVPAPTTTIPGGVGGTLTPGGDGAGGPDFGGIAWPGGGSGVPGSAQENPIALYGEVRSHSGGDTYMVEVWARPPRKAPSLGVIPVVQGLIADGEVIPNGTPVVVVAFPEVQASGRVVIAEARMQVPVWLGEAS